MKISRCLLNSKNIGNMQYETSVCGSIHSTQHRTPTFTTLITLYFDLEKPNLDAILSFSLGYVIYPDLLKMIPSLLWT